MIPSICLVLSIFPLFLLLNYLPCINLVLEQTSIPVMLLQPNISPKKKKKTKQTNTKSRFPTLPPVTHRRSSHKQHCLSPTIPNRRSRTNHPSMPCFPWSSCIVVVSLPQALRSPLSITFVLHYHQKSVTLPLQATSSSRTSITAGIEDLRVRLIADP